MSNRTLDIPEISDDASGWALLLEETRDEIVASPDLTDEEKRRLDEIDGLEGDEGLPGVCAGRPMSETIIEDRGER